MKHLQLLLAAFATIFYVSATIAQTAVPYPDTSFQHTGYRLVNDLITFTPLQHVLQPDGKLLIGGYGSLGAADDLDGYIYRFNPDGSFDSSFGNNGQVNIDVDELPDAVEGLELLPNGDIVVMLASTFRIALLKLKPNGQIDPTFGSDGIYLSETIPNSNVSDLIIQSDQKMLVTGTIPASSTIDWGFVRRYNADGSPDLTYGVDGESLVIIDPNETFYPLDGLLQPDGKLLMTGVAGAGPSSGAAVIRLNADGSLDNTFNGDGRFFMTLGNDVYTAACYNLQLDAEGTIYVGGVAPTGSVNEFLVIALTPSGELKTSFGTGGITHFPASPYYATISDMILQSDGKFLLAGYGFTNTTSNSVVLARLNANGKLDSSFGTQGKKTFTYNVPYKIQVMVGMDQVSPGRAIASIWLNQNINIGAAGNYAALLVARYITGITSKAEEPSPVFLESSLAPNLVSSGQEITLQYTLEDAREVEIALYDIDGMEINTLSPARLRNAGKQAETLQLPELAAGMYFVVLSTGNDYKVLKLVKQ